MTISGSFSKRSRRKVPLYRFPCINIELTDNVLLSTRETMVRGMPRKDGQADCFEFGAESQAGIASRWTGRCRAAEAKEG